MKTFTLYTSGYSPDKPRHYIIGTGTLEDGIELIKRMDKQFVEWYNAYQLDDIEFDVDKLFDLFDPELKVPISVWEGADIFASSEEIEYSLSTESMEVNSEKREFRWEVSDE